MVYTYLSVCLCACPLYTCSYQCSLHVCVCVYYISTQLLARSLRSVGAGSCGCEEVPGRGRGSWEMRLRARREELRLRAAVATGCVCVRRTALWGDYAG